ncbi:FUSC family protein [Kitasatospora sp. NPDC093806]|uniref:FUSC family protein n=1 Tax=Kitasatospora sp. NPDC093806 TaxID=3155075 RepID=UPI00342152B8
MPRLRPPSPTPRGRYAPGSTARLARALSPRGALALHSVDGALSFALRAALAMALPALPLALAGRADLAVYTMLGSFTTTFGRNLPYPRRARALALVALAMTACVGGGAVLGAWARPQDGGAGAAVVIAATALVAGTAKFACDAARLSGLGAVLLLFSFAVAAYGSPDAADVLPRAGLAAAGAAVAWVLAVAGRLVHPDRPQRLAVAAALRELAALTEAAGPAAGETTGTPATAARPARHRATAAVLQAYRTLGLLPPTAAAPRPDGGGTCVVLADLSWTLLIRSAARRPSGEPLVLARQLRVQVRLLVSRRHRVPPLLPELSRLAPARPPADELPTDEPPSAGPPADELRAAELLTGHRPGRASSVLLVPALRMALGTGVAGGAALLLGLGHGYWAAITAAAVLHSVNVRTAAQRAVQRALGTAAGLLLALAVLATHPEPGVLVLVIVLLEFLLEYVVARNYGLGVVFLTPLALLLSDLAAPAPTGVLVEDRVLGSALGIAIALACALLVVHGRPAARAVRALAACTAAAEHAERTLTEGRADGYPAAQTRLAAAVVELREADDAAAGELWPAEIDPTELAAAEQRAYLLLTRFPH